MVTSTLHQPFLSRSCQLRYYVESQKQIIFCTFGNIQQAGTTEFLETVSAMGDSMKQHKTGKMCMDISGMTNFDISTRLSVVRNLKTIFLNKVPYLVLAVVKGKSMFENMTMQLAIAASMPLSNKFLDSRMFDTEKEAVEWLEGFNVSGTRN